MKRSSLLSLLAGAVLLVLLALHRSASHHVLGRWSTGYAALLAVLAASLAAAAVMVGRRREAPSVERLAALLDPQAIAARAVRRHGVVIAALMALHAALVLVFMPPAAVLSDEPILQTDYAHHYYDVAMFVRTVGASHAHWSYDTTFCAGYPQGTIFDVDVKLLEVLCLALTRLHVPLPHAFNGLVLAYFLAPPALLLLACRSFGLGRGVTQLVVGAGVLGWHGSALLVAFNRHGMCSFVLAVYMALLVAGLLDRYLRSGSARDYALLVTATAVALLVHILSVVLLAAPLLALYARSFRLLSPRRHASLWLGLAAALLVNAWWIRTVLRFYALRVETTVNGAAPLGEALFALFSGARPDAWLAALGVWGYLAARAERPGFAWMGVVSVIWYFALGNFTEGVPFLRTLEPARFSIAGNVFALAGFVAGAAATLAGRSLRVVDARVASPVGVMSTFFLASVLLPASPRLRGFVSGREALQPLARWMERHTTRDARVAFQDQTPGLLSGARLRHYVARDFIGGPFTQMNLLHNYANFAGVRFFDRGAARLTEDDVRRYADLYNIGWIMGTSDATCARLATLRGLLKPGPRFQVEDVDAIGRRGLAVCSFDVERPRDWFLVGHGELQDEPDRIEVRDATPGGVVIKFHYLETLVTEPPLRISRHPVEGSPIGFIRVDNGETRSFVIRNAR